MSYTPVIIANGETASSAFDIPADGAGLSVLVPGAMTGATLALHGSYNGTDFYPVYMDGAAYTVPATIDTIQQINPRASIGLLKGKLVSAGAEGAARTLKVAVGRVA